MKTLILILTIFIFTGQFCHGQTYSSLITDNEIYSFINTLIKTDKDRISKKSFRKISVSHSISQQWDSINFIRPNTAEDFQKLPEGVDYIFLGKQIDTLLSELDREFMFKQFKSQKDTIWRKTFSGTNLVSKRQKKPDKYYFSIPIFSIDKKVVIIYYSNYCGDLCGFGGYYIYKRTAQNKWRFVTAIGHWIS